jgi:hypothetical protein
MSSGMSSGIREVVLRVCSCVMTEF